MNQKWFIAITMVFLLVIALVEFRAYRNREGQVIYINLLGGIAALPNDFVLDATRRNEITLKGKQGRIVVADANPQLTEYMSKKGAAAEEQCALDVKSAVVEGIRTVLVQDKQRSILMSDVPPNAERMFFETLCKTRSDSRR